MVLIVDDEPLIRMIAADALVEAGFSVVEAGSADHALELLKSRPDVGILFTDVNMPGALDGIALAHLVHSAWPDIKIVVTSGRALPAALPDDGKFLEKPYALSELKQVIASVTEDD
jgi:CheY-like chemotaxis protein